MNVVRAALVKTDGTVYKEPMILQHGHYLSEAVATGIKVSCFQEFSIGLISGRAKTPNFHAYAEDIPGPITERFQAMARELEMIMVLLIFSRGYWNY